MNESITVNLKESTTAMDLYQSHNQVCAYMAPYWDKWELLFDNLAGNMWTPDELLVLKRKKKIGVVINDLKPAERTILGLFIQNKYDIKFSPRDDGVQDISDVLQKLYVWTAYSQDWAFKDIEIVRSAWCCGVGYQETYMKSVPHKEPIMVTNNINPFCIAFDPESRELITREDAQFYDRDTWVTFDYLFDCWPDKISESDNLLSLGGQSFQANPKPYADRSSQYYDTKNNRYKVTERYYKVQKRTWYATDGKNNLEIKNPEDRKKYRDEGFELYHDSVEMLYLAIMCPAWNYGEYLYNDVYHCQPRDLITEKIIWPVIELVAESINGVAGGFVEHLVQLNRLTNSAASTYYHAQKHASSTGLIIKKRLFGANEKVKEDFTKNSSDSDRVFEASDQADLNADIIPIPKGIVSSDASKTLEIGLQGQQRISSTPPALQGQQESASTSGILNSQRIEQSFVQLQPLIANIKHFLKRRGELVYYYWREYYTYPMKIRIIGDDVEQSQPNGQQDPSKPQSNGKFFDLNQEKQKLDWQGQPTNAIERINDLNVAKYDVDIEDSYKSPSFRMRRTQELAEIMQKAGQIDPELMSVLFGEYAKTADMSVETKNIIKQHIAQKQQAAQQPPTPPPPQPSFSFKGEDMNNPWVQAIIKQSGMLPPEVVQQLEQTGPVDMAKEGQEIDPHEPLVAQKHIADAKFKNAQVEGQHLKNARTMQEIADNEVRATVSGLPPSVDKSLSMHPNAFSPMGAR